MKKLIFTSGIAMLLAVTAQAQTTSPVFLPGKLAVLRGGDGSTNFTLANQRRFPAYIDVYDPVVSNSAPVMTVAVPTNGANSIWFNLHGGSEGIGFTRSADRQFLVLNGYHGDLTNTLTTPSSATDCTRGFGTIDAFTNFTVQFQSQEWFGLQPGITQNNPRGMATDGTNSFWGSGTVAGTQSGGFAESGTLFWNSSVSADPEEVQNQVESGYQMKIIGGALYMVGKNEAGGAVNNGIFSFVDINNNPISLPWAPGQEQVTAFTNLVLDFGTYRGNPLASVLTFDMNASNTIAYAADQTFGIAKYVNTDGAWSLAYVYDATNLGTLGQINTNNQGCFGIAVDFSGTNPVIYATTAESGDGSETVKKGGNVSSNRLVSIVDSGDPGTNLVATTLAVANGPNEGFRALDFTPDLRPQIQVQPVPVNTSTNVPASFNVGVASVYPVTYQWQVNGVNVGNTANISGAKSATLSFAHSDLTDPGNYTVVITNVYGAITSSVAPMTVAAITVPPSYTKALLHLTNFIGDNVNITASPLGGTPSFTYQWSFGSTQLSDGPNGHGSGYQGSQTSPTLAITNAQLADSGNYFIAVTNTVGGTNVEIASLTVVVRPPFISSGGQPQPLVLLTGQTGLLTVSALVGTQPLSFQWYQGNTKPVKQLSNAGEFNNVTTSSLSIGPAITADTTNYFCVIANSAGSITSQVASVTVIVPPAPSFLGYSNQVYTQNFDSLPDPGLTTVNTVSAAPHDVLIGGVTYSVPNPFDFAQPVFFSSGNVDGLGLSNTMSGWYGECDADTVGSQLGANCGDQTTGGIISYGDTNTIQISQSRALGLVATSTSGNTHFGLKLINTTTNTLNYINLQFLGEYWKLGTTAKVLAFSYLVDSQGTNSTFSISEINASLNNNVSSLAVSFPAGGGTGKADGTLPQNQTNLSTTNLLISPGWTPGAALWLVWSINNAGSGGQGYGVDNLSFSASSVPVQSPGILRGAAYAAGGPNAGLTFTFTSTPGSSSSFTVWSSTNVALPFNQWKNLGHPSEGPVGTYSLTDQSAKTNSAEFYRVTSP
jgi:hypothetical protein